MLLRSHIARGGRNGEDGRNGAFFSAVKWIFFFGAHSMKICKMQNGPHVDVEETCLHWQTHFQRYTNK